MTRHAKNMTRLHEPQPTTQPVDGATVVGLLLVLIALGMLVAAAWSEWA